MNLRGKWVVTLVGLCAAVLSLAGCAGAGTAPVSISENPPKAAPPKATPPAGVYRPSERMLLTFTTEITSTLSDKGETERTVTTRDKNGKVGTRPVAPRPKDPQTVIFRRIEMLLVIKQGPGKDRARIALSVARIVGKDISDGKVVGSYDTSRRPRGRGDGPDFRAAYPMMMSAAFTAEMDRTGKILRFVSNGTNRELAAKYKELAEAMKDPAPPGPREAQWLRRLATRHRKLQRRTVYGRYRRPLSESVAYLPAASIRVGQAWQVRRAEIFQVFPGLQYGIYMLTGGAGWLSEVATCRLRAIERTHAGRVAVIDMTGRRDGVMWKEYAESATGRHLDCTGEIRFNLDTGRVTQRIESVLRFWKHEDMGGPFRFIDTLTLEPVK